MRPLPARPRSDSLLRRLLSAYGLAHRPPLKTDATACCSCSHADAALPFNLRCWFARLPADLPPPSAHSSTSSRCWEPSSRTCAPSPVSVCARADQRCLTVPGGSRLFHPALFLRLQRPSSSSFFSSVASVCLSVCPPARRPATPLPDPPPASTVSRARLLRLPCSCIRPSHFPSPHKRSHPHSCTFALARPPPRRRQSP